MTACFLNVASEAIRLTLTESNPPKVLTVRLMPAANQGNRARAAARFNVMVVMEWAVSPWCDGVVLVDSRGYALEWKYEALGKWFAKTLSGARCIVNIEIEDGAQIPARWTPARVQASFTKVAEVSPQSVIDDAAAKEASVSAWAPGPRRAMVAAAAAAMREAAALVVAVQAAQGGADLGGTVPVPGGGAAQGTPDIHTGAVVSVGGYLEGEFLTPGPGYWVRVNLTPGQQVQIDFAGQQGGFGTLPDPLITGIYDQSGQMISGTSNDDFNDLNSRVIYMPAYTGPHFIGCMSAGGGGFGTWRLTVGTVAQV